MSHDQRPSRVRVVASRDVAAAAAAAAPSSSSVPLQAGDVMGAPSAEAPSASSKGGMMMPSLMFCLGCAMGGAGLGVVMLAR